MYVLLCSHAWALSNIEVQQMNNSRAWHYPSKADFGNNQLGSDSELMPNLLVGTPGKSVHGKTLNPTASSLPSPHSQFDAG